MAVPPPFGFVWLDIEPTVASDRNGAWKLAEKKSLGDSLLWGIARKSVAGIRDRDIVGKVGSLYKSRQGIQRQEAQMNDSRPSQGGATVNIRPVRI